MANGADGSITIDTELDNSGFEKGSDKLLSAMEGLQKTLDAISDTMSEGMDSVIKALQQLGSQAQATAQTTSQSAQQAQNATTQAAESAQQAAQATEQANQRQAQSAQSAAATQSQTAAAVQSSTTKQTASYSQVEKSTANLRVKLAQLSATANQGFKNDAAVARYNTNLATVKAKIDELKNKLKELGSTQIPTPAFAALQEELQKAEAELDELRQKETEIVNAHLDFGAPWDDFIEKEATASDKVDEIMAKMQALKDSGGAFDTSAYDQAKASLDGLTQSYNTAAAAGQRSAQTMQASTAQAASAKNAQAAYNETLKGVQTNLQLIGQAASSAASSTANFVRSLGTGIVSMFRNSLSQMASLLGSIASRGRSAASGLFNLGLGANSARNPVQALTRSLTSLRTILITRVKSALISSITAQAKAGLQSLAVYSNQYNAAMSSIMNSTKVAGANIAVSMGNLVNAVAPALTAIINMVSKAVTYINMLFAALTGRKTVKIAKPQTGSYAASLGGGGGGSSKKAAKDKDKDTKANKKNTKEKKKNNKANKKNTKDKDKDTKANKKNTKEKKKNNKATKNNTKANKDNAKSSDKAAKEQKKWKNELYDFDELTRQSDQDLDDATDAVDDYTDPLEDMGDVDPLEDMGDVDPLEDMGDVDPLEDITDPAEDAAKALDDLAGAAGGAGGGLEDLWEEVPVDLPDWLQDIADMIKNGEWKKLGFTLAEMLADALDSIPWDKIQKKAREIAHNFAELLNGVFLNLHLADSLGHTIAEAINTGLYAALEFIDTFDWAQFGKWWGYLWNAFVRDVDWQAMSDVISHGANGIVEALTSFFDTISATCESLGQGLGTVINGILVDFDLSKVSEMIISAVNDINLTLQGLNETIDWDGAAKNMINGLNTLFDGMKLDKDGKLTNIWAENGKQIGILIGNFVGYIADVLTKVDWQQFGTDIGMWFSNAFAGIDPNEFADVITGLINGIVNIVGGIVESVDWGLVATNLTTALNGIILGIDWNRLGQVIGELFKAVLSTLNTVIDEVDWVALGEGIGTALCGVDWPGVFATVGKAIIEALGGMIKGIFSTSGGWQTLAAAAIFFGLKFVFNLGFLKIKGWIMQKLGLDLATQIATAISGAATAGTAGAAGAAGTAFGTGGTLFSSIITAVGGGLKTVGSAIATGLSTAGGAIATGAGKLASAAGTGLSQIGTAISGAAPVIGTAALAVADAALVAYDTKTLVDTNNEYKSLAEERNSATQTYCDKLAEIYQKGGQEALDAVTGTHMSLQEAQAQAQQDFADVPTNMWEGFKGGWDSYFGEGGSGLWGLVKDAFSGMIGSIKSFLGIASPSTVMQEIGDFTMQGLVLGISNGGSSLLQTVLAVISPIPGLFASIDWSSVLTAFQTAWDGIGAVLTTAWTGIQTVATTVWTGIQTFFTTVWTGIQVTATTIWTGIQSFFTTLFTTLQLTVTTIWTGIQTFLTTTWTLIQTTATTIWTGIQTFFTTSWTLIQTTITMIWTTIQTFLQTTWTTIQTTATTIWTGIQTFFTTTWNTIKTTANTVFTSIKTFLITTWNNIKTTTTTVWNAIKTLLQTTWTNIKTNVTTSINNVKTTMQNGWNQVKSQMSSAWNGILSSLRGYLSNMLGAIRNQIGSWASAGGNLVHGLLNGLQSAWSSVMSWASSAASALTSTLRSAFSIHSPSKVWAQIGQYLDMGLLEGLQDGERSLLNQTSSLAEGMSDRLQGSGSIAVNGTVSGMDGVVSNLGALATIFTNIAQALSGIGTLPIPQIAAGTVVPAKTAVASSYTPADNTTEDTYLDDIRVGLQNLVELLSGNSNNSNQTIQVMIDGKAVFQAVVDENNRAITRTGRSPIRV